MSTQIEILLKARDEATKTIQTAFKNAEQSLSQFNVVAGQTGKTIQKAGKEVSTFSDYMRQGRMENRQFGFVMREVMDIVGGAALMIKLFGGNSSESERQAKRLSEAVMMGYVAFQATETIVSLGRAGLAAYKTASTAATVATETLTAAQIAQNAVAKLNLILLIAQGLVMLGTVTYALMRADKDAAEQAQKLADKMSDLNRETRNTAASNNRLKYELKDLSEKGYQSVIDAAIKLATDNVEHAKKADVIAKKLNIEGETKLAKEIRLKASTNSLMTAEGELLKVRKENAIFLAEISKASIQAREKDLKEELDKNNKLISFAENYVQKIKEIQGTMGVTGVALKRKQLLLEAESLRETLDKEHSGRTKNNALYKQALDNLGVYTATKGQQITDEDNKQNEAKVYNAFLAGRTKEQAEIQANEQKKFAYELTLVDELGLLNQQYDEIEKLYDGQTEKDAVNSQRRIAIAELEAKKKQALIQQVADFSLQGLSLVSQFANQSSQAEILNIEKRRDSQLVAINDELEMEGLAEERRAELLVQKGIIEAEAGERISAAKKEQFENQKAASIIEAIINTAVALTKTLAYPWMYPMIAALGAAQVALIYSQPTPDFHKGGSAFVNAPASQEGFLPIKVRGQETVRVNTESQEANRGSGITINFNSPVSDTQFITNSIKKVLNQSGLSLEKAFVNNRNKLQLN